MRDVRVAESGADSPGSGEARLLATAALVQQVAQAAGLLALLVVVTLLARRLSVAALGAYGLVASLAGYLLVLRNSVATAAVRAMAGATEPAERSRMFSAAAALYAVVGTVTGLVIVAAGAAIAGTILSDELARDGRLGALGLGLVTAAGIAMSVHLDALRAERLLVRAATLEILAVTVYLVAMVALILAGAGLAAVITVSGALPLLSGTFSLLVIRRRGLPFRFGHGSLTRARMGQMVPTAGWLLVVELSTLAVYGLQRIVLGAYRTPTAVGLFEGPLRAHNLFYALGGALAVPTVPTASRYVATEDRRRLHGLAVRGTRYTLALFVPLVVTLMVLGSPILDVWLGDRYGEGGTALAILVSYWALYGGLAVTPGFLVGVGRAREVGLTYAAVAAASIVISLVLTPELGLEGPALAVAVPFVLAFPWLVRVALAASGATVRELATRAWGPNYLLGGCLAALLVGVRQLLELDSLPLLAAVAIAGPLLFWAAFYALVLDAEERVFARGLVRRS